MSQSALDSVGKVQIVFRVTEGMGQRIRTESVSRKLSIQDMIIRALELYFAANPVDPLESDAVKATALSLSLENYRLKRIFRNLEQILQDPRRGPEALAVIRDAVPRWNIKLEEGK